MHQAWVTPVAGVAVACAGHADEHRGGRIARAAVVCTLAVELAAGGVDGAYVIVVR